MASILIIEDEKDILNLIEFHLKQTGCEVLKATDGEVGLELAIKRRPDLIILDLMLPLMDGKDVCRTLKANPLTKNIPVLMLTAKAEEIDRIIGFELGADDYVTKPFSPRELVLRVRAILRRNRPSPDADKTILIGDLLIDKEHHQASLKGRPLNLTVTEFKLLFELAAHRGKILTRQILLDRVWGYSYEGYERTVDTHIRRLRAKLGEMATYIETHRGFGYRFRGKEE